MSAQAADPGEADLSRLLARDAARDAARDLAARDPFVRAGLRTFAVHRWRLNEGSISVRLSLGTGGYEWD